MPRIALLQMTSGIDPAGNAATLVGAIRSAAGQGAVMLFTPEMSGLIDRDRARAAASIVAEADDPVLARVCAAAAEAGIWVHVGSLAVRRADGHTCLVALAAAWALRHRRGDQRLETSRFFLEVGARGNAPPQPRDLLRPVSRRRRAGHPCQA